MFLVNQNVKMQSINRESKRKLDDEGENETENSPKAKKIAEDKLFQLVSAVHGQEGFFGQIVIIANENDNAAVTLQNTLQTVKEPLCIDRDCKSGDFILKIGDRELAKGKYSNKKEAKADLSTKALEELRKYCFYIDKRKKYKDISNEDIKKKEEGSTVSSSSAAHKMMLKMGWSGGGLGAREQGNTETVKLTENINRLGLGSQDIPKEVGNILRKLANSSTLTTLIFEPGFSKEERSLIHQMAWKLNLKSKSEGRDERRITVSRKVSRYDLVKELLRLGGEDDSHTLHIPTNFNYLLDIGKK